MRKAWTGIIHQNTHRWFYSDYLRRGCFQFRCFEPQRFGRGLLRHVIMRMRFIKRDFIGSGDLFYHLTPRNDMESELSREIGLGVVKQATVAGLYEMNDPIRVKKLQVACDIPTKNVGRVCDRRRSVLPQAVSNSEHSVNT